MNIVLSDAQQEALRTILLAAFNRTELGIVLFQMGEDLDHIALPQIYPAQVKDVVLWANKQNRVWQLLTEARIFNPGNLRLRDFTDSLSKGQALLQPQSKLPLELRIQLLTDLLKLPIIHSFDGRSSLLFGLPHMLHIQRCEHNAHQDISTIIDQLDKLGKLQTGAWPLLIVSDNALAYLQDFQLGSDLRATRNALEAIYQRGENE